MAYTLGNKCAKNCCKLVSENWNPWTCWSWKPHHPNLSQHGTIMWQLASQSVLLIAIMCS